MWVFVDTVVIIDHPWVIINSPFSLPGIYYQGVFSAMQKGPWPQEFSLHSPFPLQWAWEANPMWPPYFLLNSAIKAL